MATVKQIEANRRNARKSTGPKTPEGKAAVRLNSLRHGLRARTAVLPSENAADFQQLCDDLEHEWRPSTRSEQFYVEQMALSHWKLRRVQGAENQLYTQNLAPEKQIPLLDRLWRAQSRMERSYQCAQQELEKLQQSRRSMDHHGMPGAFEPAPKEEPQRARPAEPVVVPIAASRPDAPAAQACDQSAGKPHLLSPASTGGVRSDPSSASAPSALQ